MEQPNQQISQKPPLPIKTKIAAWWMIVMGVTFLIISLLVLIFFVVSILSQLAILSLGPIFILTFFIQRLILACFLFLLGIFFYLKPGLSLLKNKKEVWKPTVIKLSLLIIPFIVLYCFYTFFVYSIILAVSPGHSLSSGWEIVMVGIFLIPFTALFTPLILLLLDRKNFFKTAS